MISKLCLNSVPRRIFSKLMENCKAQKLSARCLASEASDSANPPSPKPSSQRKCCHHGGGAHHNNHRNNSGLIGCPKWMLKTLSKSESINERTIMFLCFGNKHLSYSLLAQKILNRLLGFANKRSKQYKNPSMFWVQCFTTLRNILYWACDWLYKNIILSMNEMNEKGWFVSIIGLPIFDSSLI